MDDASDTKRSKEAGSHFDRNSTLDTDLFGRFHAAVQFSWRWDDSIERDKDGNYFTDQAIDISRDNDIRPESLELKIFCLIRATRHVRIIFSLAAWVNFN